MWTVTNTGRMFRYDKFDPAAVCLEDIAHALSFQCRYNGHCHAFYTTAEHSMHIADCIARRHKDNPNKKKVNRLVAQALLHDAAEAYVGDMPGPFKAMMPEFDKYEKDLMSKIFTKYKLPKLLNREVKEIDMRILLNEKAVLFPKNTIRWEMEDVVKPLEDVKIMCFTPMDIYPAFLKALKIATERL